MIIRNRYPRDLSAPRWAMSVTQAQIRAFGTEHPIGDPFSGPAYGDKELGGWVGQQLSNVWNSVSGGVQGMIDFFGDAAKAIGKPIEAVYREVVKPVGKVVEGVVQNIQNDPVTFIAQVAAVSAQQYWALPLIQAASVAANGGNFENVLKATAISAATVYAGGTLSKFISNGISSPALLGNTIAPLTANTIGNVIGYSSVAGISAALQGKDPIQAAATAGVIQAVPLVLNQIPGFDQLGTGASGLAKDVEVAIKNSLANTAGAVLSSVVNGTDMTLAAGNAVLGSLVQGLTSTKNIVTNTLDDLNVSEGAKSVLAGTITSVISASLTSGKASASLSNVFASVAQREIQSYLNTGTGLEESTAALKEAYKRAEEAAKAYEASKNTYEPMAEERNALAEQINADIENYETTYASYEDNLTEWEFLRDGYEDFKPVLEQQLREANAAAAATNAKGAELTQLDKERKTYIDAYNAKKAAFDSESAAAQYWANLANAEKGKWDTYNSQVSAYNQRADFWNNGRITVELPLIGVRTLSPANAYHSLTVYQAQAGSPGWLVDRINSVLSYQPGSQPSAPDINVYNSYINNYNAHTNAATAAGNAANGFAASVGNYNNLITNTNNEYNKLKANSDTQLAEFNLANNQYQDLGNQVTNLGNTINAEADQINKFVNDYNNVYMPKLEELDTTLNNLKNQIDTSVDTYYDASGKIQEAAKPITEQMQNLAKTVAESTVKELDPNFNAQQYAQLNNLPAGTDPVQDWLARGKDLGLFTNQAAAQGTIDVEKARVMGEFYVAQGLNMMTTDPQKTADLSQKLEGILGNNVEAWRNATAANIVSSTGISYHDFLTDVTGKDAAAKFMDNAATALAPGWYQPSSDVFTVPAGMKYATQEDIAKSAGNPNAKIYQAVDKQGHTVYLKQDPNYKPVKVYDKTTGDIKSTSNSDILGTKTFDNMSAEEKVAFLNALEKGTISNDANKALVAQAGATGVEDAKKVVATISNSKLSADSKDTVMSLVSGAGNVAGFFGQVLQDAAKVSSIFDYIGAGQAGSELSAWSSNLTKTVNASRSEEALQSAKNIQATLDSAGGTGVSGGANSWWKVLTEEPKEVLQGMWTTEFAETLTQEGTAAAVTGSVWATAAAMGKQLGSEFLVKKLYIPISAALDGMEAYSEGKQEFEDKVYGIYLSQGMSKELAREKAQTYAIEVGIGKAATAAVISGASDLVGAKMLIGPSAPATAVRLAMGFFAFEGMNILSDMARGAALKGIEEGAIYLLDPSKADLSTQATQGALIQATLGRGTGTALNTANTILSYAYLSNDNFNAAVKETDGSMTSLANVFKAWVPEFSTDTYDVRSALLPTVLAANPEYAANNPNPQDFIDTVQNEFGIWEPVIQADIANVYYNDKIVTATEAKDLLAKANVTTPTTAEVTALVGVGSQDAAAAKAVYLAQISQMYNTIVGREPDAYTLKKYTDNAYQGIPLPLIQQDIATSYEVLVPKLTELYKAQKGRAPTTSELVSGVTGIKSGAFTLEQVQNMPLNTYQSLVAQIQNVQNMVSSGLSVVNAADLQTKVDALRSAGMTTTQIQNILGNASAGMPTSYQNALSAFASGNATALTNLKSQSTSAQDAVIAKVKEYMGQGYSSTQALQAALDTVALAQNVSASTLLDTIGKSQTQLSSIVSALPTPQTPGTGTGNTSTDISSALSRQVAANETAGMARDAALQLAIDQVGANLGVTRTELLNAIDISSQQFTNQITIAKTELGNQLATTNQATNQQIADTRAQLLAEMARSNTSLTNAIDTVAINLGVTREQILSQLNTTEQELKSNLAGVESRLTNDIGAVSALLGKPATQVTANDITTVQNMLSGKIASDLGYDVNRDGKVDTQDLTLIQTQLATQTDPNVITQVDPVTGQTIRVDKTTGKPITEWNPAEGTTWAPTGLYAKEAEAEAARVLAAQTAAKTAATNQKKTQFSQMMNMVLGAPDVAGQKVEVKTPDPARINYVYDFSSIFANPQQAGLFASPYGAVNTYGQSTQPQGGLGSLQTGMGGQAANQGQYKMAIGGYAEGGMIGGDISVGENGSVDDLLNILKGNE